jgi:hypothetical protein
MAAPDHLNSVLARYLDRRLAETVCDELLVSRLYGLEVIDADGVCTDRDGAARFICIGEGSADSLLDGPAHLAAYAHDAVALVSAGWSTPLTDPLAAVSTETAPPVRRRVVVTVVGSTGGPIGSVLRDCATGSAIDPGPVVGRLADRVADLWAA